MPGAPLLYFSGTVLNVDEPSARAERRGGHGRGRLNEFRVARVRTQDRSRRRRGAAAGPAIEEARARADPSVPQAPGAEPPFEAARRRAQAPAQGKGRYSVARLAAGASETVAVGALRR